MSTPPQAPQQMQFLRFFHFIRGESEAPVRIIVAYTIISGVANAILLGTINRAADLIEDGQEKLDFQMILIFLTALALFFITKKYILTKSVQIVERTVTKVRLRILNKIRHADLKLMEDKGKEEIYTRMTVDIAWISQTAANIISSVQGAFMIFFTLLYILYLSYQTFLLTLGVLALAAFTWLYNESRIHGELRESSLMETRFFRLLNNVLDGFKEIKLNIRKNDDIYQHSETLSHRHEELKLKTATRYVMDFMFSQMVFYALLGAIVFVIPVYSEGTYADDITKISAAVLFIMGPVEALVGVIPIVNRANSAVGNIQRLETELDDAALDEESERVYDLYSDFDVLEVRDLKYSYTTQNGREEVTFVAGPFNFQIRRGELVFIVGGNGSGKSTLLKMLTGLYNPQSGYILLDDKRITPRKVYSYRELFSAIFTDFHLFDRIYGIPDLDEDRVNALLEKMQLGNKLSFENGEFSSLHLSTGQRKRIGLISTILEDKPVYIFDEVAADQDPQFRQYFYEVLLREFQASGKTIIMVTHDDKYFDHADRIIKMDMGRIISDSADPETT